MLMMILISSMAGILSVSGIRIPLKYGVTMQSYTSMAAGKPGLTRYRILPGAFGKKYSVPVCVIFWKVKNNRPGKEKRNGGVIVNRILLIDDDRELCALIRKSVLRENVEADCCFSGKEGIIKLDANEYHLVVLDVMMPESDGFGVLEKIREKHHLPVLMLTAKDDCASKVRGLRAGADDYLTKPFEMDELIARILSLIRRYTRFNQSEEMPGKIEFDGLVIDTDNRSVTSVNGVWEMPPKEFDVLLFCARHQGKILTKQQIYEEVWKEPYVYDDSNIMAIISRVRKKIEENPGNPKYIQTVKGIGYRFSREV